MHAFGASSQLFRGTPAAVAEAFRRHRLGCVQLTPSFPGRPFRDPGHFTAPRCRQVAEAFQAAGVVIVGLANATNLMDPDLDRRHQSIMRLHALVRHARDFGTDCVVTESGSPSPRDSGTTTATIWEPETWLELGLILKESLGVAAEHGVRLLLKADSAQVLGSLEDCVRLRDDLGHPNLGFVLDPANLLESSPLAELDRDLERLVDALGPWSPVVHAKDLRLEPGGLTKPPAGVGMLDYGLFFRLLARHQPDAPIILEHVRAEEVARTKRHLEQMLPLESRL